MRTGVWGLMRDRETKSGEERGELSEKGMGEQSRAHPIIGTSDGYRSERSH